MAGKFRPFSENAGPGGGLCHPGRAGQRTTASPPVPSAVGTGHDPSGNARLPGHSGSAIVVGSVGRGRLLCGAAAVYHGAGRTWRFCPGRGGGSFPGARPGRAAGIHPLPRPVGASRTGSAVPFVPFHGADARRQSGRPEPTAAAIRSLVRPGKTLFSRPLRLSGRADDLRAGAPASSAGGAERGRFRPQPDLFPGSAPLRFAESDDPGNPAKPGKRPAAAERGGRRRRPCVPHEGHGRLWAGPSGDGPAADPGAPALSAERLGKESPAEAAGERGVPSARDPGGGRSPALFAGRRGLCPPVRRGAAGTCRNGRGRCAASPYRRGDRPAGSVGRGLAAADEPNPCGIGR